VRVCVSMCVCVCMCMCVRVFAYVCLCVCGIGCIHSANGRANMHALIEARLRRRNISKKMRKCEKRCICVCKETRIYDVYVKRDLCVCVCLRVSVYAYVCGCVCLCGKRPICMVHRF
jgi:hypothetical protein